MTQGSGRLRIGLNAGLLVALGAALLTWIPSVPEPMGWDQALYAVVGREWLRGGLPFVATFDIKPPLAHLLYGIALQLGQGRELAFHLLDLLFLLATVAAVHAVGAFGHSPRVGAAAAVLFAALAAGPGVSGGTPEFGILAFRAQPDILMLLPVTLAVRLFMGSEKEGLSRIGFALGCALLGVAALFKWSAVLLVPVAIVAARSLPSGTRTIGSGLGLLAAASPVCAFFFYYWLKGHTRAVWEQTVLFNLAHVGSALNAGNRPYQVIGDFFAEGSVVWVLSFAALAAGTPRSKGGAIVRSWLACALLTIVVQGRGWGYHLVFALAPACIVAVRHWDSWRRDTADPLRYYWVLAVVALAGFAVALELSHAALIVILVVMLAGVAGALVAMHKGKPGLAPRCLTLTLTAAGALSALGYVVNAAPYYQRWARFAAGSLTYHQYVSDLVRTARGFSPLTDAAAAQYVSEILPEDRSVLAVGSFITPFVLTLRRPPACPVLLTWEIFSEEMRDNPIARLQREQLREHLVNGRSYFLYLAESHEVEILRREGTLRGYQLVRRFGAGRALYRRSDAVAGRRKREDFWNARSDG